MIGEIKTGRTAGRVSVSALVITLMASGLSVGIWGGRTHRAAPARVYTSAGLGGYVGFSKKPAHADTEIQRASDFYAAGRYADAERAADDLIKRAQGMPLDKQAQHIALLAQRIKAYSAGYRQDYRQARERFEQLRQAAYLTPDHGAQKVRPGEVAPTLEEEGAFQKAVCTSALGDKAGAEAEWNAFLRDYPKSLLVHAAVKRIARYHAGNVPKESERLWKAAMHLQKAEQDSERKSEALCGPECLAELLRREAGSISCQDAKTLREMPDSASLTGEMKTDGDGTSLAAMQASAARHGLRLRGLSLTVKGLAKQKLPVITLIEPGHYVLVEAVNSANSVNSGKRGKSGGSIVIWNPDALGLGKGGRQTMSLEEWNRGWHGVVLGF